jgi:hypothetical protein
MRKDILSGFFEPILDGNFRICMPAVTVEYLQMGFSAHSFADFDHIRQFKLSLTTGDKSLSIKL